MNAAMERRLTLPLAVAVLLLGALLLALLGGLGRQLRWDPPRAATATTPRPAAARLPPPVPLQHYAEVWQKPLFSPDRKPSAHAAGGASNIGDLELTGIIITPELRMALLRKTDGGQEIRVREGAALPDGSSTLTALRPRSALFDSPSGQVELKLPAGARIDLSRGDATAQPPAAAETAPDTHGSGLSGEPEEEPPGGTTDAADGGDASPEQSPLRRMGLPPASPASSSPAGADEAQDARVRQLKAAIRKRRADQAAPASHEGDR